MVIVTPFLMGAAPLGTGAFNEEGDGRIRSRWGRDGTAPTNPPPVSAGVVAVIADGAASIKALAARAG